MFSINTNNNPKLNSWFAPNRPPFWLFLAVEVAIIDQITKWQLVQSSIMENPLTLTPFLRLVYAENTGSAFSFLAGEGEWARWLLVGLATLMSVIMVFWICRRPPLLESAAISLILGGAIGNLIDRIRLGYVVDFVDFYIGKYHWPAFNVADSAITLGVILLLWVTFFKKEQPAISAQ